MPARLVVELQALEQGRSFDLIEFKDRIVHLHQQVSEEEDRVTLIKLYLALMSLAERSALRQGRDAAQIRGLSSSEHRLFLITEASDSQGNIVPDELARLTQREVDAGRLASDDEFHHHALAGARSLGGRPGPEPREGFWQRLFGGQPL